MRARAWTEPAIDEDSELKPRETPNVAARLTRTELSRTLNENVILNFLNIHVNNVFQFLLILNLEAKLSSPLYTLISMYLYNQWSE